MLEVIKSITMKRDELFDISNLIFRELAEELTSEERRRLEAWLGSSERNRTLYEHICSEKVMREKIREYRESDVQAAFEAFLARKERIGRGRRLVRYVSRSAAVLVLPLVLAVWYWAKDDEVLPTRTETVADLTADVVKNRPILTLSSGRQMVVGDSSLSIAEGGGVRIQVDGNGMMSYNASDSSDVTDVYNTMRTPVQCDFVFTLEDGTRVWLNADSKLRYPSFFDGGRREVELEGEAYFDVARDTTRPFIVRTGQSVIQVFGTEFNVKAYPDEREERTTLVEGSVGLRHAGKVYMLRPNDQAVVEEGREVRLTRVDARKEGLWRTGMFVFERETLESLMGELARWYNVTVFYTNERLKTLHFSGELDRYEDIGRILHMVGLTTDVTFSLQGRTVIVSSGGE